MTNTSKTFVTDMSVRSYECDMQGVVNNAVYQNYLEYARHMVLMKAGFNLETLMKEGINLTLAKAEINYFKSLRDCDRFQVKTAVCKKSPIRYIFEQEIVDLDNTIYIKATMTVAVLNEQNRPAKPPASFSAQLDRTITGEMNDDS